MNQRRAGPGLTLDSSCRLFAQGSEYRSEHFFRAQGTCRANMGKSFSRVQGTAVKPYFRVLDEHGVYIYIYIYIHSFSKYRF